MTDNLRIVKLYFTAPVHLGDVGIGLEENSLVLHSDTIFNAICNALAKLNGTQWVTDYLEGFNRNQYFRISSGFPFNDSELFFPKPRSRANINEELYQKYGKKLKNIAYLSQKHFEKWIAGDVLLEEDIKSISKYDLSRLCREMPLPKVSVSRVDAGSNIYFLGSMRFREDSGLWFIVDCDERTYDMVIQPALRLLQHDGIGGKRTWGYGAFRLEDGQITMKLPEGNAHLLLSLYYPINSEKTLFAHKRSRWDIVLRGGHAYPYGLKASEQKPQSLLISEGSVFGDKPNGKLIEFESHIDGLDRLYHNGIAYSIPISIRVNEDEMQD